MDYKEIKGYAKKKNAELQANAFNIESIVKIEHNDESILQFRHAIVEMIDNHVIVFTEHHGYFVYPTCDLVKIEHNFDDRSKKPQTT